MLLLLLLLHYYDIIILFTNYMTTKITTKLFIHCNPYFNSVLLQHVSCQLSLFFNNKDVLHSPHFRILSTWLTHWISGVFAAGCNSLHTLSIHTDPSFTRWRGPDHCLSDRNINQTPQRLQLPENKPSSNDPLTYRYINICEPENEMPCHPDLKQSCEIVHVGGGIVISEDDFVFGVPLVAPFQTLERLRSNLVKFVFFFCSFSRVWKKCNTNSDSFVSKSRWN